MPLADFAQMAIPREHLATVWRQRRRFDGGLSPESDGGATMTTSTLRRRGPQIAHLYLCIVSPVFLYADSLDDQSRQTSNSHFAPRR